MKKVKHILNILLSGYLIVAMGGLVLFNHTCSCNNETLISLFAESNCCNNEASHNSCNAQGDTYDNDQCDNCSCETKVEIFATDYTTPSEVKTHAAAKFILHGIINSKINFELPKELDTSSNQDFKEKVPPITGRYLHILYQNLKIPFPNS